MSEITEGTPVIITDANGAEHRSVALREPQPGHKFMVVWVNVPKYAGGFEPMPWPLDSVRPADEGEG